MRDNCAARCLPCRAYLALALALLPVVLAGCDRAVDEPRVQIVRIARADAALRAVALAVPEGLRDRIERAFPGTAFVDESGDATIRVVPAPADDHTALIARRWVPAASPRRLDLTGVALEDLQAAAAAGRVVVERRFQPLVAGLFPAGGPDGIETDDMGAYLLGHPEMLALLPVDTATARVQTLAVDGIDLVRERAGHDAYPLVTRVRVQIVHGSPEVEAAAARLVAALAAEEPPPVRLTFTGDLIPTRCVYDRMRQVDDWAAPFRKVAQRLRSADLTIGSLDATVSDKGQPIGCRETFNLLAPPQVVEGLTLAGFDAMTIAANHAKDCGSTGYCGDAAMRDTITNLSNAGILPFGGGRNVKEARRPAILTAGGTRFALLGYDDIAPYYHAGEDSGGTAGLDLDTLAEDVQAARALADVVIVLPHWGEEYTPDPTVRQQRAARIALDAGAALVIGNHPHTVQAAMPFEDGYVAFALGNFVFDQDWSVETTEGVVLEATFIGTRLAAVRFLPIRIQRRLQPEFLSPKDGAPILRRMSAAAERLVP